MKINKLKRIVSYILLMALICTSMASTTGCGKKSSKKESEYITQGEWLAKVNELFGMTTYNSQDPYFDNIKSDNKYFAAYQTAKEWNVVDDNMKISPSDYVTQEVAAQTLVNVADLSLNGDVKIKNESKLKEADKIKIAVSNKIFSLDKSEKFDTDKKIKKSEAEEIIARAKDKWTNPEYKMVEEYKPKEGTVDVAKSTTTTGEYKKTEDNKVFIPTSNNEEVKAGQTYLLPPNSQNSQATVFVAESVEPTDGGILITNTSDEVNVEEIMENMDVQNSFTPDFSTCAITDGNGNLLETESEDTGTADGSMYNGSKLQADCMNFTENSMNANTVPLSKISGKKKTLNFNVTDKLTVSGSIDSSSVEFSLKGKLANGISLKKSYKLSDFDVDGKVKVGFFKLKQARASYTYKCVETTSLEGKIGINDSLDKKDISTDEAAKEYFDKELSSLMDLSKGKYSENSILIASIPTPLTFGGVAGVVMEIRVGLTVEGKLEIIVTSKTTQGIEYKRGSGVRVINEKSIDRDFKIEANTEMYIYLGLAVEAFSYNIVDVGAEFGVGAKISAKVHLLDTSETTKLPLLVAMVESQVPGDQLAALGERSFSSKYKIVTCVESQMYPLFRITVGKNSLVGKIASGSWDILGPKTKSPFNVTAHFENGKYVGDKCTLEFRTDKDEDETTTDATTKQKETTDSKETTKSGDEKTTTGKDIMQGTIDIDQYSITLDKGKTAQIKVLSVPEGYKTGDVKWSSDNTGTATVDSSGKVTAVAGGTATITVQTKDGKYSITCSIYVNDSEGFTFKPL